VSSTDSKTRRQHDDELEFGARFQPGFRIKEHSGRTQIASQAGVLGPVMAHLDRHTNWHARSGTAIGGAFMLHMLRKCTPVRKNAGAALNKKLLPVCAGGVEEKTVTDLKRDLQSELRSARSASTQERVADAHVAGGGESQVADATASAIKAVACWIGNEVRQVRVGEIRVVEDVEELSPEL
jgi:hypothetical protein